MPPNICVSNTAVAIYLATSINHLPISFFFGAKIQTIFETAKFSSVFLFCPNTSNKKPRQDVSQRG